MTYEEFDKKYNARDYRGVIQKCSIIDMDGNIIFHGNLNEIEDYWDNNIEIVWENKKVYDERINGKSVITTNLAKNSSYTTHCFNKLNFKVA